MKEINIYTDGAARGNPGPAGIGAIILDKSGNVEKELADYIGEATNNVAEYQAVIAGLEAAKEFSPEVINIFADSQLVIRQLKGEYRVKSERLRPYYEKVQKLLTDFNDYNLQYIPREKNKEADKLANVGIDQASQSNRDKVETDPQELSTQLQIEAKNHKISQETLDIVKELEANFEFSNYQKEKILRQGIIYGILLSGKLS
jgi:ribonuclease HI